MKLLVVEDEYDGVILDIMLPKLSGFDVLERIRNKEINSLIKAHNRMLDRMNEIFDQQEQFSSDVAHELKTPIAVIKSDEEKKAFEVILKQAQKMLELVITLLMLSRLESGDKEDMQEFIDLKEKVFTRLFKSDSSRNSSGYGLGMPIALKIAKKHGGTIEVESKLGKGSCFTIYLSKNK